jgi:hypothetical protein
MPTLPLPNLRARPHTARIPSEHRRGWIQPVGGVDFRTGEPVLPKEYAPKPFRAPLTSRIRTRGTSNRSEAPGRSGSSEVAHNVAHPRPRVNDASLCEDLYFAARSPPLVPFLLQCAVSFDWICSTDQTERCH